MRGYSLRMSAAERKQLYQAWLAAAEDSLTAAQSLREEGRYRSSVSRSYYAAYSFLAAALVLSPGVTFKPDREGPDHAGLADLARDHLKKTMAQGALTSVRTSIVTLYDARVYADYKPKNTVNDELATASLKQATTVANTVRKIKS